MFLAPLSEHVLNVVKKLSKFVTIIYRIQKYLNEPTLNILYHTLICPNLTYCITACITCITILYNYQGIIYLDQGIIYPRVSLIYPNLTYCITAWDGSYNVSLTLLKLFPEKIFRAIRGTSCFATQNLYLLDLLNLDTFFSL